MTHTKKRILAMLLAVVLMFGTLPFSVSADEVSSELPTESTVESQPEESQAEDSTPSDGETAESSPSENRSITISDSSGDVPVVYAIDPYDEIKNKAEGGSNDMTQYGVTRAKIVSHLEAHEHDFLQRLCRYELHRFRILCLTSLRSEHRHFFGTAKSHWQHYLGRFRSPLRPDEWRQ